MLLINLNLLLIIQSIQKGPSGFHICRYISVVEEGISQSKFDMLFPSNYLTQISTGWLYSWQNNWNCVSSMLESSSGGKKLKAGL